MKEKIGSIVSLWETITFSFIYKELFNCLFKWKLKQHQLISLIKKSLLSCSSICPSFKSRAHESWCISSLRFSTMVEIGHVDQFEDLFIKGCKIKIWDVKAVWIVWVLNLGTSKTD